MLLQDLNYVTCLVVPPDTQKLTHFSKIIKKFFERVKKHLPVQKQTGVILYIRQFDFFVVDFAVVVVFALLYLL